MTLRGLGLRLSKPPVDLVTRVQEAAGLAIPPSPVDDEGKERGVSMDDSESMVSSDPPPLPSHEPYWVTDIEPSVPPPADEAPPSPSSTPRQGQEEESSSGQSSIESRLLLASFPLACSTILLVIDAVYGVASVGWLILGGLAWSGIILSAGIILKTAWDCVRKA
jgi:hypothetical protein